MIIHISEYADKKVLILGYGGEGKSTELFLRTKYPGISIKIADQSEGEAYLKKQNECDFVIKTPGIPKKLITKPYTTATNIFFELVPKNQIIGVTGSKGKSTTASLIAHILKKSGWDVRLIGNIGKPALDSILTGYSSDTIFVYELSSYQLDDIQYSPHISVITALFPDHIPYHGTVEKYYNAKHNLLKHAESNDYVIYNKLYKMLTQWAHDFSGVALSPSGKNNHYQTKLIGKHNQSNIALAVSVARLFDISERDCHTQIQSFEPLPHRLENIGTFRGINFYDDAISTTPESTIAALQSLEMVETILLGGQDRGYQFNLLAETLEKYGVNNIVLFPDAGTAIEAELAKRSSYKPKIFHTSKMREAVSIAFQNTSSGSICLLSTASPSYSIWKNFIEKGKQFQTFVRQYAQENQNQETTS